MPPFKPLTPESEDGASKTITELEALAEAADVRLGEITRQGDDRVGPGATPRNPRFGGVNDAGKESHLRMMLATEAIERKYSALGGALSPLSLPTSNGLTEQSDGSLRRNFRGGHVSFSPDTGNVDAVVNKVAKISYRGLHCFGRQEGVGKDEPYVVASIVQPDPFVQGQQIPVASVRIPEKETYKDVTDGSTNTMGTREFWADAPRTSSSTAL